MFMPFFSADLVHSFPFFFSVVFLFWSVGRTISLSLPFLLLLLHFVIQEETGPILKIKPPGGLYLTITVTLLPFASIEPL